MIECSSCGTELTPHEIRCPTCGKTTAHYHRQRRCLHCGTPAAEDVEICIMCHRPVDSFPLSRSIFSGSWLGIGLGVIIIVALVSWVNRVQGDSGQVAVIETDTPTATLTITRTPTATGTPTLTPTVTPTPTPTPRTHIVESGETLIFIAEQYGVEVNELMELNNIEDARSLRVGQTLIIPQGPEPEANDDLLPFLMVYVVEEGDTLSSIAYEHGTPMEAILAANPDVNLDLIYPGQEIIVPLSTPTPTPTPTPLPTETPTPGPSYLLPDLLVPSNGQVIDGSTLFLNWTSTGLLAKDEFYVVKLIWPNSTTTEHWVKNSSWRISKEQRPAGGLIIWTVTIMRQTGTAPDGSPIGKPLTLPGKVQTFRWR